MRTPGVVGRLLALFLLISPLTAQDARPQKSTKASPAAVSDLDRRLSRFREVKMPLHSAGLSARELKLVKKLVDASSYIEEIFWRQIDPDGLTLYESLAGSKDPGDLKLRRYLRINASRFDLLDANRAFVGSATFSLGRGFYPQGVTREQIEQYVRDHPGMKEQIYSATTIVVRRGDHFEGLPYHIAYRSFLEPAARDLREAAALSDDPDFSAFLRLRADALLSDDYFKSDLAWLALKRPKFDVIFAPYETYDDDILGTKRTYGAAVLIRNAQASEKIEIFQKYIADIQDALPLAAEDRPSKRGLETPIEVMESPFRAGDLNHGYQAVADALPNDAKVLEARGSKRIFFKNYMDARVNYVVLPLAKHMMRPEQAARVSNEGYLLGTIMHEIAHGLGPSFARTASGKAEIPETIGAVFDGLEEAKADTVGLLGLKWLVDHGALSRDKLEESYASFVADIFRSVRFGMAEAHGQAEMMEFNYLVERGAIRREPSGRYVVDYSRFAAGVSDLARILLEIEATGDRARAESWFKQYDVMPPGLQSSLQSAAGVPVDIDPVFSLKPSAR